MSAIGRGLSAIPNHRKVASATIFRSKRTRRWAQSSDARLSGRGSSGGRCVGIRWSGGRGSGHAGGEAGAPGRRAGGCSGFQEMFPTNGGRLASPARVPPPKLPAVAHARSWVPSDESPRVAPAAPEKRR